MPKLSTMTRARIFSSLVLGLGGAAAAVALGAVSAGATTTCDAAISTASGGTCEITGYAGFAAIAGHSGENLVNTYYKGLGVDAATNTITATVDTRQGASAPAIAAGDTILVLENQGALTSVVANPNPVDNGSFPRAAQSYGSVSGLTAGTYQLLTVKSVSVAGSTTTITTGQSINPAIAAVAAGALGATSFQSVTDFQVVRVPSIVGDAVLKSSLTALPWSAAAGDGGVFALSVSGQLNMNGMNIDVNGEGFAGGAAPYLGSAANGPDAYPYDGLSYPGSLNANGQKGEGVSGTPNQTAQPVVDPSTYLSEYPSYVDSYPTGDFGMGALGNAGGGSTNPDAAGSAGSTGNSGPYNDESTGGGGGANGGAGGQGGYSFASGLNEGGYGGHPLSASSSTLFFGGGGGGGSIFNDPTDAGSGGAGGGAVLLQLGGITGAGTISANGAAGSSTAQWADGGSGGGAGGTIVVQTSGLCDSVTSSLQLVADGGAGGNAATQAVESIFQTASGAIDMNGVATGPGGGGGGGAILTNLSATGAVAGGPADYTVFGAAFLPQAAVTGPISHLPLGPTPPSPTAPQAYGATAGGSGTVNAIAAGALPAASTTACVLPTTTTVASVNSASTPTTQAVVTAQTTVVTVPATRTGAPLASDGWLAIFALGGAGGAAIAFPWRSLARRGTHFAARD